METKPFIVTLHKSEIKKIISSLNYTKDKINYMDRENIKPSIVNDFIKTECDSLKNLAEKLNKILEESRQ